MCLPETSVMNLQGMSVSSSSSTIICFSIAVPQVLHGTTKNNSRPTVGLDTSYLPLAMRKNMKVYGRRRVRVRALHDLYHGAALELDRHGTWCVHLLGSHLKEHQQRWMGRDSTPFSPTIWWHGANGKRPSRCHHNVMPTLQFLTTNINKTKAPHSL